MPDKKRETNKMCSIVGYWPLSPGDAEEKRAAFQRLFYEGSVRGLHAFGLADVYAGEIRVVRSHEPEQIVAAFNPDRPTIAHTRYSLSGDWHTLENNQPLVVGNRALAFNGVISMKTKEEMEAEFNMILSADNDGEVFLQSLALGTAPGPFLAKIPGSFAGVWLDQKECLWAGRNKRRPLWMAGEHGGIWYASTGDIFRRAGFKNAKEVECTDLAIVQCWNPNGATMHHVMIP